MKKSTRGFSLVELSISIAIIGIIGSSIYSIGAASIERARERQTEAKMELLVSALEGYLWLNHNLLCPAQGALPITDINYGISQADCTTGLIRMGNIAVGMIPFKTMQLPEAASFDGWGRRFTYVVDTTTTVKDFTLSNTYVGIGIAAPLNTGSTQLTENQAIFLLLSHGSNGHGAWPKVGGNRVVVSTAGPFEVQNARLTTTGSATASNPAIPYIRSQKMKGFGNKLSYRTHQRAIQEIGTALYGIQDTQCMLAKQVLFANGTDSFGAPDPTQSGGMAFCKGSVYQDQCTSFLEKIAQIYYQRCAK